MSSASHCEQHVGLAGVGVSVFWTQQYARARNHNAGVLTAHLHVRLLAADCRQIGVAWAMLPTDVHSECTTATDAHAMYSLLLLLLLLLQQSSVRVHEEQKSRPV